ncbi:alpha/beta fold hydrolase, partial [Athalassotoga sp.]|uniref:alpha/beta fold hydrolase n=1 Tax=Athalassotoga sp. TaxID=2022597 RepID=UPI003CFFDC9B
MFVQIENVRIFYETNGDGMPVVYVHGNFASSKWFEEVMKIDGIKTYALDLPNFGNSDRIDSISIEVYADYLSKFIESLKISRPILVGHSLGGA